jgi:tetratricopeptide (TPR) repeat protein
MKFSRCTWITTGLLAALLVGGVVLACQLPGRLDQEYPDPPFSPVSKDFPRIIALAEWPAAKDKKADAEAWENHRRIFKKLKEQGAYQRATPAERKALDANAESRYIDARELSEKVLKENPESVPALFVLAGALEGQGNLPQALFRIRTMRHLLQARGLANPEDADGREWYLRGLVREKEILHLMDRRLEELRTVELIEKVYGEELPWEKFWALIKLERFEEADAALQRTANTGRWPTHTLNNRITLESQKKHRTESYEVGKTCVADKAATALIWKNFSGCCQGDFRLKEAEEAMNKCVKMCQQGEKDFVRTPYIPQASFHLNQGRLPQAWEALNLADRDRKSRSARTQDQDRADMTSQVSAFLLVFGNSAEAERLARRAWEQPTRHGSSTDTEDNAALGNGVLYWNALRSRQEERKESAAVSWLDLLRDSEQQRLAMEAWMVKRALLKLLADDRFLNECLRPYLPHSPGAEPWLMGTFVQILPPGVAAEALRQARASESHPGAVPYFDAMEAELELRGGRSERALELASRALEHLPVEEKLLRGRTAAVAAEAARLRNRMDECREYWNKALVDFPAASRLLQVAIPVRIEDDGSPLAQGLSRQLVRSPRFVQDPAGLRVVLKTEAGQLAFALYREGETLHFTERVPTEGQPEEVIAAAGKQFHERLTSPSFRLTLLQINSLGGRPSGASATAQGLLNKMN